MYSNLIIRFVANFIDYDDPTDRRAEHVRFYKFLPNGIDDKLEINGNDYNLKFWFEQCGFMNERNMIVYDSSKREINPERIKNQDNISGGFLFGELAYNINNNIFIDLCRNNIAVDNYKEISEKTVSILEKEIENIYNIFRYKYGQFWLFNNDKLSLHSNDVNSYLDFISAKFYNPFSEKFELLRKGESNLRISSFISDNRNLINESDWNDIKKEHSFILDESIRFLQYANKSFIDKIYSKAVIESNTALEIAVNRKNKELGFKDSDVSKYLNHSGKIGVGQRAKYILKKYYNFNDDILICCDKMVKLRNDYVHSGKAINEQNVDQYMLKFLYLIKALIDKERIVIIDCYPNSTSW